MEHLWVPLALASAFSLATSDALTKKALSLHNEYLIAWLRLLFSLPFLLFSLLFIPVPQVDRDFFIAFVSALPLEVAATILYIKALKVSPLGLTLPFLSLTPLFLLVIPNLILGEEVSPLGTAGVLFIVSGSYMLNSGEFKRGLLEPFIAIKKEKGSLFMIIVALLYSFTSTFGKMAIGHSSPLFFGATYITALFLVLTPITLYKSNNELRLIFRSTALSSAFLPGLFNAVMIITHMTAMSLTQVAYMVSVKRLSLLIGVFYGYLFFKESGIKERLLGTGLMVSGFGLIVLYH